MFNYVAMGESRMKQWQCDKCNKIFLEELCYFKWGSGNLIREADLCEDCLNKMYHTINTFLKPVKEKKLKRNIFGRQK